jgi:hypothetical protein
MAAPEATVAAADPAVVAAEISVRMPVAVD